MAIVKSPAEHWRAQLEAWALPKPLLASVPRSPYAWPAAAFARMAQVRPDPVTGPLVERLLVPDGSLLDVGAGAGRLSLPVAASGHRVTAVEPNEAMADELERLAASAAIPVTVLRLRWPEAAVPAGSHDVVVSANVVYDVGDIAPFVEALHRCAGRAVVVELTQRHPWDALRRYYRALHGVSLPDGPNVDDLVAVVESVAGVSPQRRDWPAAGPLPFDTRQAMFDLYQARLCVTDDRRSELEDLLAGDIESLPDGSVALHTGAAGMSTLWWFPVDSG